MCVVIWLWEQHGRFSSEGEEKFDYFWYKKVTFCLNSSFKTLSHRADHQPAILHGYKVVFNMNTGNLAEPAFAGLVKAQDFETHGVAFCMDLPSVRILDEAERWYTKSYTES